MSDPTRYDYSKATLEADLVMKGGITSGVIYPHAVCELAQTYRFRSIGGTSAGAIAAALSAAAECGRQKGLPGRPAGSPDGFVKLAELPGWLGRDRNLFRTFQPQAPTRRLFAVFTAGLGTESPLPRVPRVITAALRHFPVSAALGAAPGMAAAGLAVSDGGGARLVAPVALAVGGSLAGVGFSLYRAITGGLPENLFGLCTGMDGAESIDHPAVTPWLNGMINELAGLPAGAGRPLTFRDLEEVDVELQMVTTSLSNGRPFRLPFGDDTAFFFDPDEMRQLFPDEVVTWMETCARAVEPREAERIGRAGRRLVPMPDRSNLPVIVATRMSLSFPGLMSAVPLWAVDLRDELRHCWFSDGGIVSNFPVHFFDSPLPRRPTFAINLRPFPEGKEKEREECRNVWMPPREERLRDWWYPRWEGSGRERLVGFGRAILDTMQNWSDNTQIQVPGYRDRIAHVNHTEDEGGMNLNMDADKVRVLAERGRCAGAMLADRFSRPQGPDEPSWDNHRWLRFRSSLNVLEKMLAKMGESWHKNPPASIETSYPELVGRKLGDPPGLYPWQDEHQRQRSVTHTSGLIDLIDSWRLDEGRVFERGAPEPEPQLRIMPHW